MAPAVFRLAVAGPSQTTGRLATMRERSSRGRPQTVASRPPAGFSFLYVNRCFRSKSCTQCLCSMLGRKLLLGVLALWDGDQSLGNSDVQDNGSQVNVRNGHIKRITDNDIQSLVLEIEGTNVSTTYITCPADPKKTLGIKLPFLVMIIKNLKKYFTFEVQVLDDKNVRRRFRASNYQSTTRVKPFICTMPMRLDDGWNQIQFNLSDFTRRAYGTNYIETLRVQIHANCRIRRVYFSDRLYSEDELPAEFKLYLPVQNKAKQ
ncbi:PREDICTED: UPF0468 protein C16orf80 homolog [Cariama cristata]|uniref:UPF0468 protein C16orf80 homolog n=1 Tax=Cariama cristata TaxID=54380 RepID=UPI0005204F6D|nr:PREDICTED: UPF0468 protein C16orf80 homolog [Cariama cristata]